CRSRARCRRGASGSRGGAAFRVPRRSRRCARRSSRAIFRRWRSSLLDCVFFIRTVPARHAKRAGTLHAMNPAIVITCACLVLAIAFGARAGFGLYLQPISFEFGWGREVLSLSLALQQIVWGALGPFAGALADRYGSARVIAGCGALYALGLVAMAFAKTPSAMHFAAGLLVGGALAGATFATVLAVVGRTVAPERRSTALGVATAAGSFGQFALLPVTQLLIGHYDWHTALLVMAGLTALIMPLAVALQ